jgi:hypothetical protein
MFSVIQLKKNPEKFSEGTAVKGQICAAEKKGGQKRLGHLKVQ